MSAVSLKNTIGLLASAAMLAGLSTAADAADAYPTKAIQLVVPYNPGGDTDLLARVFAKEFEKTLGKPVVVVNVAGAAGSIATTKVKNAPADGYTVLFHHSGVLVSMITGAIDFSYKDMAVLGSVALSEGTIWVTNATSPYKDMADIAKAAKAAPETVKNGLNFGSQSHAHVVAFERAAGVRMHNMDVGGIAEKIVAILGGHIDVSEVQAGTVSSYIQAGRMRALGTPAANRFAGLPEVKTFKEQGIDITMPDRLFWLGLPPNTAADVMKTLTGALEKTAKSPDIAKDYAKIEMTPFFKSAVEATVLLDEEYKFLVEYKDVFQSPKKK
ncbi:MAG: tripartite tricarboxylate transporter substrate binding protein [Rhodospirillales bacterium]|nr:tripartite tricarboxylate transporter substrate binding protein [Rhodospirillales bacterium]